MAHHYEKDDIHHLESDAPMHGGAPIQRAVSYNLTPEQFEKLYLQPGGVGGKGDLAKRFANPTPIGVVGFLLCLTPLSMYLMGFAHSNATSAVAQAGPYIMLGGVIELLAGIGEFILGNTFPCLVFLSFGAYWVSFGILQLQGPGAYATAGEPAASGALSPEFNDGIAIYLAIWGVVTFIYLIASLRTNVAFVILFATLDVGFFCLVDAYLKIGKGIDPTSILKIGGGFLFVTTLCGWWILAALVFGSTGMPIPIPVGDLSGFLAPKQKAEDSTV